MSDRRSHLRASFQFKLFGIFTALSLLTSCIFISVHIIDKIGEIRRHAGAEVKLRARQLADSVRLPLYAEDRVLLAELAGKVAAAPGITRVTITSQDGRVLADCTTGALGQGEETIAHREVVASLPAGGGALPETRSAPAAIGAVRIERGTADIDRIIYQDIAISCLFALLFWLAVSALSFLVLRRTTRSFEALVRGVMAMREGDYHSRIEVLSADEAGRMAEAVNALAETLAKRDKENRTLTRELVDSLEVQVQGKSELAALNRSLAKENLERLHAEQAARKSEETLKTLMDIMPVGVLLIAQDGSVEYVNNFLVDCFGYQGEEIPTLERWFALAFPDPQYRQEKLAAQQEALSAARSAEGSEPRPYDARVTCKHGQIRHVLLSNQLQDERTIVVVIDITDREVLQEQLNKVQKLESLGVLAGGIAHNFNNALTGVMGFISLTRCKLESGHEAHALLKLAEKASLRAAEMAKQLLTFARGGAPVKKSIELKRLLDEVVALTFNSSNVRCVLELPASLPPVRADEGQMVQALSNIVINAMQAMPEGGTITIRATANGAPCADRGHLEGVGWVTLSIADQGHGIAPENLPKIFDPYFSTKETTGLGLASVHSIIYRHGGHITVASEVDKGTTFTICLPAAREPAVSSEAGTFSSSQRRQSGSVLVMDDDPTVRELSGRMLGFLGFRAVACADGREAVDLYRANRQAGEPFFAAILDLTVPGGMGGVEAARLILDADPQANLIVSSGYSNDPVMARYRSYGFCGAVTKPYKADQLSQELAMLQ
ncbi:ATP-binding protein [Geomonas sp.]|uniref:hybrid sensor histidine kinase/response regulator n=1 Tax=Geomonas sp. TaxID=2651584 RepID=UPI002B4798B7|nr:ATP-binding protein [Geomonas sp.]HJV34653.1 ATP-binding protein [Geomonas sp.]